MGRNGDGGERLLELPSLEYERGIKLRNLDYSTKCMVYQPILHTVCIMEEKNQCNGYLPLRLRKRGYKTMCITCSFCK